MAHNLRAAGSNPAPQQKTPKKHNFRDHVRLEKPQTITTALILGTVVLVVGKGNKNSPRI